ncbi:VOC family protein [Rhizobium sp. NPDC090275]|uniref:VOC family protein n=1 Tax=Rhizobium sp. NPDC090275 TaxID=3364498 RepID=UPI00383B11E1
MPNETEIYSSGISEADLQMLKTFYRAFAGQPALLDDCVTADWQDIPLAPGQATGRDGAKPLIEGFGGSAEPRANRTAILEFMVSDVDAEFARLKDQVEVVHEPKDLPWGNRTMQISDPEGTRVALYTPVTDAAKKRFAGR